MGSISLASGKRSLLGKVGELRVLILAKRLELFLVQELLDGAVTEEQLLSRKQVFKGKVHASFLGSCDFCDAGIAAGAVGYL
jgi:hypothetical protein